MSTDHLQWTPERHEIHDYLVGLGFAWTKHSEHIFTNISDQYTFGTVNFVRRDKEDEIHTLIDILVMPSGKWSIGNPIPIGHGSRGLSHLTEGGDHSEA